MLSIRLSQNEVMRLVEQGSKIGCKELGQQISDAIREKKPLFVSRLGKWETEVCNQWMNPDFSSRPGVANFPRHLLDTPRVRGRTRLNFLVTWGLAAQKIGDFVTLYMQSAKDVDILGSWLEAESDFFKEGSKPDSLDLQQLDPWFCSEPWSAHLRGQRVVVVHPFSDSIGEQYANNRKMLFESSSVLPEFDLRTVQAFFPGVRNPPRFRGWKEALRRMEREVFSEPFDVAIIGCGPLGIMLGSRIKRAGKVAIHLGGSTQILFGIMGRRWEVYDLPIQKEFWIRPAKHEMPTRRNLDSNDRGTYW